MCGVNVPPIQHYSCFTIYNNWNTVCSIHIREDMVENKSFRISVYYENYKGNLRWNLGSFSALKYSRKLSGAVFGFFLGGGFRNFPGMSMKIFHLHAKHVFVENKILKNSNRDIFQQLHSSIVLYVSNDIISIWVKIPTKVIICLKK